MQQQQQLLSLVEKLEPVKPQQKPVELQQQQLTRRGSLKSRFKRGSAGVWFSVSSEQTHGRVRHLQHNTVT